MSVGEGNIILRIIEVIMANIEMILISKNNKFSNLYNNKLANKLDIG